MALTHLVDTSVLTRLHRRAVRAVVEPMLVDGRLGRALISDLEVGFSARSAEEWDGLAAALGAIHLIEVEPAQFRRAFQVQRLLAAAGLKGRKVPDLLVAATAEGAGLAVLHYDADFDHIASVTGQRVEWVVPARTIP